MVGWQAPAGDNGSSRGVCCAIEKAGNNIVVFLGQDRAGAIDERTAGPQGPPHGIKHGSLRCRVGVNVVVGAVQLDVGATTEGAGAGARGIDEDAVKRRTVPPGLIGGIALEQAHCMAEPCRFRPGEGKPMVVPVNGRQAAGRRLLGEMKSLATRCRAGVEHTFPGSGGDQMRRDLRVLVLNRDQAGAAAGG